LTQLRIRFSKLGKVRWTSHRDTARMWERALRRVGLPVAYSQGFSPHPKVSFGLALSTGYESLAEYLDVDVSVTSPLDLDQLSTSLSAALPEGVDVVTLAAVEDRLPSLQEAVTACTWRFAVAASDSADGAPDISAHLDQMLASESLVIARSRKGRMVHEDIRPAILAVRPLGATADGAGLECDLASQPRSLRPTEFVAALGDGLEERNVCRLHQWIERDGARCEPLSAPLVATDAPHALVRAS
jgi:radical SAM-linked protein